MEEVLIMSNKTLQKEEEMHFRYCVLLWDKYVARYATSGS
jgi:hypothetical protein